MPATWETVSVNKKQKKDGPDSRGNSPRPASKNSQSKGAPAAGTLTGYFAALENAPLPDGSGKLYPSSADDEDIIDLTTAPRRAVGTVKNSSNNVSPSPAPVSRANSQQGVGAKPSPKKTEKRTAEKENPPRGVEALSNLDASRVRDNVEELFRQRPGEPLKGLAQILEDMIGSQLRIAIPIFGKNFSLEKWEGQGPLSHTPKQVITILTAALNKIDIARELASLVQALVEQQKKALTTGSLITNHSIGHMLLVQLIASKHPNAFFESSIKDRRAPANQALDAYRTTLASHPAIGHTLLWACAQQRVPWATYGKAGSGNASNVLGLEYWMRYCLPLFVDSDTKAGGVTRSDDEANIVGRSVAVSVQIVALDYLQQILDSLQRIQRLGRQKRDHAALPTVSVRDFVLLLRASVHQSSSPKRQKKADDIPLRLRMAYESLKKWIFAVDATPRVVNVKEMPDKALILLLAELKNETNPTVRAEVLDVLTWLIADDVSQYPLRSNKHRPERSLQSPVLAAWVNGYEQYIAESGLLARRIREEGTKRARGKVWKKIVGSEMRLAIDDLRHTNSRMSKRIEKRKEKVKTGSMSPTAISLAHPTISTEDVRAADRELRMLDMILPKKQKRLSKSILRFLGWMLFLSFIWTVANVMCAPDSRYPCPLNDPRVMRIRAKVVPKYENARETVVNYARPFVQPAAETVAEKTAPVRDQIQDKWRQFTKTEQYHVLYKLQTSYITPWLQRVNQEWNDAALFVVEKVMPSIQEYLVKGKEMVQRGWPVFRMRIASLAKEGRRLGAWIVLEVEKGIKQVSTRLRVTGLPSVQKIVEFVSPYYELTAHIRSHVAAFAEQWMQGFDFIWRVLEDRVEIREWEQLKARGSDILEYFRWNTDDEWAEGFEDMEHEKRD